MLRNDLYRPWFVGEDWGFEFISGDFKDLAIQIEDMKFEEQGLDFKYHIVNQPELITEADTKSDAFGSLIEIVINDILNEALENYDKTGNNDSKESNP
jgi:hypothetical protein